ncbi:MAG: hypothetical protein A2747_02590 [Candidatus Yonathbacteria bacterium RIFCSPHIGHO2_01_FULL_44_41]|uniref:PE-PGRS family protein n=1 Tax=Candidatus Yonathbacteria bacterium RIFCSPHIGHO2_02_FULL_44_14 TaxID=1802724 RepID=A0A1G2S7A3_9BACT|nr:MAG: hypothetical protein A2747_02590 [Candidatus Yonathbacteria bacterium RIFCSPHIGHO2_01_FULL_44_41]OHA80598.1 MAG: hypothetical protein A3D51_00800 [Candidatus Yonathbacteria bacterium RIFCSPHIGHO2_02_FULL_44_14]OHA82110.1 MAG: hypothetical protein A3B06_01195 [Candidatus Yonathbacteria bacterium RIFCSPLOWO2_01_FULL_43_20]
MQAKLFNAIKVTALAFALALGVSYVYAWTGPTQSPPGGNVATPINVSGVAQVKAGALTVGSLNAGSGAIFTTGNISGWNVVTNSLTTNALQIPGTTAGKVLTSDASGNATWQAPASVGGSHGKQRFTSNGMFTVPAGVTTIWVSMSGGGGGGGGGSVAGGTSPGQGGSGGISSFGTLLSTSGGVGGRAAGNSLPWNAGSAGGSGGAGGGGSSGYFAGAIGGAGGGSIFGAGGSPTGGVHVSIGGSAAAGAGSGFGAGGAGGPSAGGGGGGAHAVISQQITVVPFATHAITVGLGGTAGFGSDGQTNAFGGTGSPGFVLVEW